jgi:hypothetical protein
MTEQPNEAVVATIRFGLMDYMWTQLWCRWVMLPWTAAVYLTAAIIGIFGVELFDGDSPRDVVAGIAANWTETILILLVGLAAIVVIVLAIAPLQWMAYARGRDTTVTIDDGGIAYASRDLDIGVRWPSVRGVAETASSFLVRGKRVIMRLPKRAFSQDQLARIRAILDRQGVRRAPAWRLR